MKKKINDFKKVGQSILESYKAVDKPKGPVIGTFKAEGIVQENTVSQNGTYYESQLWEQKAAFGKGGKFFDENGKIKPSTLLGSLDHPSSGQPEMRFENSAIAWRDIYKTGENRWDGVADILDTPAGRIVKTHLDYAKATGGGSMFGISLRGYGDSEEVYTQTEAYNRIIPENFELMALDFVYDPSFSNQATLTENRKSKRMLVESIQKLAEDDKDHADIYKEYAEFITKGAKEEVNENKEVKPTETKVEPKVIEEVKFLDALKSDFKKALKDEAHKLHNLIYDVENMSDEDFNLAYPKKDKEGVLAALIAKEKELLAALENLPKLAFAESKEEKPVEPKEVITEASDLDAALDELEKELAGAPEGEPVEEEGEEETPEDEEGEPADEEGDEETPEDEEEGEEQPEPTLAEVMNKLDELQMSIDNLMNQIQPVEDFDYELDLEELPEGEEETPEGEEELNEEPNEEDEVPGELEGLTEDELEALSDEELLELLGDE